MLRQGLVGLLVVGLISTPAHAQEDTPGVAESPTSRSTVVEQAQAARAGLTPSQAVDDVKVGDVIWAPAIADPGQADEQLLRAKPEAVQKRWYGEPILIADSTAYTCLLVAAAFDMKETHEVFIPPALIAYSLAGPITHATQGNWGRASASLAIRLGIPFVALLTGAATCIFDSECGQRPLVFGVVGMAGASAIDIAALARERVPPPQRESWVTPQLALTRQQALLGAAGSF